MDLEKLHQALVYAAKKFGKSTTLAEARNSVFASIRDKLPEEQPVEDQEVETPKVKNKTFYPKNEQK